MAEVRKSGPSAIPEAHYYEMPEEVSVYSWCPRADNTGACTQVHVHFGKPPGNVMLVRFKGPGTLDALISALLEHRTAVFGQRAPIDMVLPCPSCGVRHVDAPDPAVGWTNPPHRSHLCRLCKCVWRPADVPTNGVATATTRGQADTWPLPPPSLRAEPK